MKKKITLKAKKENTFNNFRNYRDFEAFCCGVAFALAVGKEKSNHWLNMQFAEGNLKPIKKII